MTGPDLVTVEVRDLMDDPAWLASVAKGSAAVLVVGAAATAVAALARAPFEAVGLAWIVAVALASLVVLPVHELVHGAAFKLLGGRGAKVRMGYRSPGMLYACANGLVLPRRSFMAVVLAPTALISTGFAVAAVLTPWPLACLTCLWLHLSGCTGDLAMARDIAEAKEPYVRDTEDGFDLLAPRGWSA